MPNGETTGETSGKLAWDASEKLDKIWDKMYSNKDLFQDSQMMNDNLTWRLLNYPVGSNNFKDPKVVLKGLISQESIEYSVSHNWEGGSYLKGVDAMAQGINKVFDIARSTEAYMNALGEIGQKGLFDSKKMKYEGAAKINNQFNKLASGASKMIDRGAEILGNVSGNFGAKVKDFVDASMDMAHARVVTASQYVKLFQGTSVNLQLPQLTTTIFNSVGKNTLTNEDGSVESILRLLNDVFIGAFNSSSGIMGIQEAPNSWAPEFNAMDTEGDTRLKGTFCLQIGNKYTYQNLLINDFSVQLSNVKCTYIEDDESVVGGSLWANISISLMPTIMYNKSTLNKILSTLPKPKKVESDQNNQSPSNQGQ